MHDMKPCGRTLYDGEKCICHSKREDKDVQLFQKELDRIFGNEKAEYYDLTGFIFPKKGYKLPREYKKDTYFTMAMFSGEAHFLEATFSGEAYFRMATFSGTADFGGATFSGKADFRWATFSGEAYFGGAMFWEEAYFGGATFSGAADFFSVMFSGGAYFGGATFSGSADFDAENNGEDMFIDETVFAACRFTQPEKIRFRKVSLANCRFLETDVSQVQFIDVGWTRKGKFWFPRNAVHDELTEYPDYTLIAQLYRRLQANYVNNYRYSEASDFYIGEQEMVRKAKGKVGQYLSTNFLYKIISYYGESFTLPLLWLAFILLAVPAVFLYDGINLTPDLQNPAAVETVNYEWSWSPGDFLLAKSDYWGTFVANFSLIAYSRSDIGKYLPESHTRLIVTIESLIVIALLAFFLLALRRQYKRKTF